ncbi:ABC transporter ATP-binding protein [Commensalibacter papalotli (ex Botero et al. 2024)]|uniref:ATPase component (LolD) (PDB:5GKO) n=1 Tax=Commensalibacter papalotli (ex Botero et al. 2024) TaxID=2972766 RepID=A0ABM9HIN3_9PROT|nr:ATP-binding cassette domain-containing protein [Commensalibacter papalotli (ex Botero et al. 2024)]CAI3925352.1 ABC-type lipoprotein export system [Commensalibacter papalotli (ex Botero et al. 2024)]CAI3926745.1 ABC-type lipoprotein export system [Commensalibacter papalotli (ex Botero et al. 2024)]
MSGVQKKEIFNLEKISRQFTGGISIEITKARIMLGDKILISGPSGCGKSTMLGMLSLALKPDRGKTFLCDQIDILQKWKNNKRDDLAILRASLFGFIPQTAGLIPFLNIQENISMPQRLVGKKDQDWFFYLVNRLEINQILYHKPHQVSVGQRQRVAVARALINHPLIVLADEPTASVHPSLADGILELLLETIEETGAALIMTSHDTKRTLQYGLTEVPCELDQENQITRLSYEV